MPKTIYARDRLDKEAIGESEIQPQTSMIREKLNWFVRNMWWYQENDPELVTDMMFIVQRIRRPTNR